MNTNENFPKEAPKNCDLCPRLVEYRHKNASENPDWFNGPAPSFGDENGELLVIGLAPGRTGANRTGRPFTGDYAGQLLYDTLKKFGYLTGEYKAVPNDGIILNNVMITNAVRCAPPENKPIGAEINICNNFLKSRIKAMVNLKTIICLGLVSHNATLKALEQRKVLFPFGHANIHQTGNIHLIDSYHCSKYNTLTKRLTTEMFENVFDIAAKS